jgi:uncharacterized protein YbjT (DUF2867 family)
MEAAMILVIGGRSRTGRELIRLLREAGAPLRILTRSAESPDDPDAIPGDLARPDTLDAAMAGAEKVFLLCSAAQDELAWHRNAIDAAARAGVAHLVRSSILAANPASPARFIRHHGQADEHLRESGVPHTILRPNFYMHNVSTVWPSSIGPDGNYYAPAGDARISMTDARDVAAVAARVLLDDARTGTGYDVTGPEALSHAEACEKLSARLGRPVRYVPVEDGAARSAMLDAGLNHWMTDALIELYQDYRRSGSYGYAAQVASTVPAVTGRPAHTLDRALADDLGASGAAPQS